ncbi:MAG TPA: alpha/beta fold hydrolase [Acidobacteriaceae bacterium]|nr:alpha/beta fold hydrolase [Acidobacteriaceae bacterium]
MFRKITTTLACATLAASLSAQTPATTHWPTRDGVYTIANFRFGTGETLPELRLHYLTLGTPHRDGAGHVDNAVLLLHGTGGNAANLIAPQFSGVLFAPGQPLDITHYFLIFPDDIGHGSSSKPSDGLHMRFPRYDYDDMVRSQHQMLLDGLHVDHLRLILGTSMGCMQSFVWGEMYPEFSDALMPLACLPTQIAGRNRMMRYMNIQNIKLDPAWHNGEYTTEPLQALRADAELSLVMGSAPLYQQKLAPTRDAAETYIDNALAKSIAALDANNAIYYWDASRNYDPSAHLDRIQAPVMWINSADDFINPPELGIAEKLAPKIPHAKFVLIPISDATRGHGTHTQAAVWKNYLIELLAESEKKPQ